jgi:hypothetical protein
MSSVEGTNGDARRGATTMTTTILIKRNADRNYDKLFAAVEASVLFRRDAVSLSERETPEGYAVEFKYLDPAVVAFAEARPKDYEIL